MDDLRKTLHGDQRMATVHSGEEILLKGATASVGCTNVTDDRQTTDDRRICDSKDRNVLTQQKASSFWVPEPLTRGFVPGPCWGHSSRPPSSASPILAVSPSPTHGVWIEPG